ncbi:MAG: Eco29kI family restriction endonuclease [Spirochaetes bacterium]|nr:Eco29kI family restriction endonuclease [Spirochaetota bacterium]
MFDYKNYIFKSPLFESVVEDAIKFFSSRPLIDLPLSSSFSGSGIYAIYYFGKYDHYKNISKINDNAQLEEFIPIYVGKAVNPGWRTARSKDTKSPSLYNRLNEHSRNITQCDNLELSDFKCRFLILTNVEGDLIVPIEAKLIRIFTPMWNSIIDGFGNHDPGSGRYEQAKSEWDVIHPGRSWASRLKGREPKEDMIIEKINNYMSTL